MRHPPLIGQRGASRKQPACEVGMHDSNCLVGGVGVGVLKPLLCLLVELVNGIRSHSNPLVLSPRFPNLLTLW